MFEWLIKNGFDEIAGCDDCTVHAGGDLYVSLYNGDGYWHIFRRVDGATYEFDTAAAKGNGLKELAFALKVNGWKPKELEVARVKASSAKR